MRCALLPLAAAFLLPLASSTLFITSPTASTALAAGKSVTLTWLADPDTTAPRAAAFGAVSLALYTGSSTQQTLLQTLGNVSDPVKTTSLAVKIDPRVGPDSSYYFIRLQSLAGKDASGAPLQAFSARFKLTQMNGTFTPAEAAQNSLIGAVLGTTVTPTVANASASASTTSASSAIQTVGQSAGAALKNGTGSAINVSGAGRIKLSWALGALGFAGAWVM